MDCKVCGKNVDRVFRARTCASCCILINKYIIRKAASMVHKAIRDGALPKLNGDIKCTDCDSPAKQYDHRDYFKPLEVDPVCISCNQKRGTAKNRENLVGGLQRFILDLKENRPNRRKVKPRIKEAQRVLKRINITAE